MQYIPVQQRPRTVLIDIDGTIFQQSTRWPEVIIDENPEVLPGVRDKLIECHMRGDKIVLLTARPYSYRYATERQLERANILYHRIVFGLPTGQRVLINDCKPDEPDAPTAIAINLVRDVGLEGVTW